MVIVPWSQLFILTLPKLEAVPEAVPLQRSVKGLHLHERWRVQLSAFASLLVALIPLPLHTVSLLIMMVVATQLYLRFPACCVLP